ncbi:MAG: UDP-2,4-diacetamido-2,4,6-trideoxy-beta-L-altropyranose hydrolase [Candidatus Sulfotelmatobacter sp.]
MNPGLLLIRADASVVSGTGHVMRCLALAQEWQVRGGRAAFAMAEATPAIHSRLKAESCDVHFMPCASGTSEDSTSTIALAHEVGADWIVVDGYQFGAEYQRALKSAGLKVLLLDDYGHATHYYADLVLNQNPSATQIGYSNLESYSALLLGPRYCLLRREFQSWRNWKREVRAIGRRVLVTMGGSDPENLTAVVVKALGLTGDPDLEAIVVIGGSSPYAEELERLSLSAAKKISVRRDVSNIAELMAWADVAVSSAGSTCWELCLLGLPALLFDVADNQKPIARELNRRGCSVHLGSSRDFNAVELAQQLDRLLGSGEVRQAMSLRCRQIVDGKGAARVASIMQAGLHLRPAREADRELLWKWANDPHVRAAAFLPEEIPLEQHNAWFASKMNNPNCLILIAEDPAGKQVGQFRVDWRSEHDGEIDVSVSAGSRGSGFGSALIELGVGRVFAERGQRLNAFVKNENQASRRAFERAGFNTLGEKTVQGQRVVHYVCGKDAGEV